MPAPEQFVAAYLEAVAFTDMARGDECFECEFAAEALDRAAEDCNDFWALAAATIDVTDITLVSAGHDFWLTRNRHGAGFWDRGLGTAGDALTDMAHSFGECWLYRGDDGLAYFG